MGYVPISARACASKVQSEPIAFFPEKFQLKLLHAPKLYENMIGAEAEFDDQNVAIFTRVEKGMSLS